MVLPAAAGAFESEGTVTSSERRVQRVRGPSDPPGESREDLAIIFDLANAWAPTGAGRSPSGMWNELRTLSPVHAGMSYARLEQRAACSGRATTSRIRARCSSTAGCGIARCGGPRAPFSLVAHALPVDDLDDEFPLRLTTGRRLAEYNTGVQTGGYASP